MFNTIREHLKRVHNTILSVCLYEWWCIECYFTLSYKFILIIFNTYPTDSLGTFMYFSVYFKNCAHISSIKCFIIKLKLFPIHFGLQTTSKMLLQQINMKQFDFFSCNKNVPVTWVWQFVDTIWQQIFPQHFHRPMKNLCNLIKQ